ncbi:MAG: hypothetical protein EP346_00245 [Bacteroidetes bacterium]|nr:MAG: hypothetical protein EP346_00245 [Bacteroidota bacterium]
MKRQIPIHTHYANGKPTHWPEKIISSLYQLGVIDSWTYLIDICREVDFIDGFIVGHVMGKGKDHHIVPPNLECNPGDDLEFVAVNRKGEKFPFGPLVKCMGVQRISIIPFEKMGLTIIDRGDIIPVVTEVEVAKNEGFDSVEHWYSNVPFENDWKIWKGGIIHWTDKQYK